MHSLFRINELFCKTKKDKIILHIPSLDIHSSKVTFILGSSGVGKTSFLQAIGLMKRNFSKESTINLSIGDYSDYQYLSTWQSKEIQNIRKSYFSFMFQEAHFFNNFSIEETLKMPKVFAGNTDYDVKSDINMQKTFRKLGLWKLWSRLDTNVNDLSVGQKQRISFIQSLQKKGCILFADEPTGNVDYINAKRIMRLAKERVCSSDLKASIIVTHDLNLAIRYADDIVVLSLREDNLGTLKSDHVFRNVNNEDKKTLKDKILGIYEADWETSKSEGK